MSSVNKRSISYPIDNVPFIYAKVAPVCIKRKYRHNSSMETIITASHLKTKAVAKTVLERRLS